MAEEKKVSSGAVEIDVAKYTEMVLKLDEAQDKVKEMEKLEGLRLPGARRHRNRGDEGTRDVNAALITTITDLANTPSV